MKSEVMEENRKVDITSFLKKTLVLLNNFGGNPIFETF